MIALAENKTFIPLAIAKPTGLNDLGVPQLETALVKKGQSQELTQVLETGPIGRRFQNLRVTGIRTIEGGVESSKIFVQFEVFGDDNVPTAANSGFAAALYAGGECVLELSTSTLFLPYARCWYENRFVFDVPADLLERADRIEFIAKPDRVRAL